MLKIFSTIAVAAFATTAAQAQVSPHAAGQLTARVPYGDLNLASSAGVAALDRRIDAAILEMCGGRAFRMSLVEQLQRRGCQRSGWASANPQRSAVIAAARRGEAPVQVAFVIR